MIYVKVYAALEGFEERLGLDPNDPLIPVVLVFGVSAVLWYKFLVFSWFHFFARLKLICSFKCKLHFSSDFCRGSYRVLKYSGYAGDLSPESAMELLRGNDSAVLIDIRPEVRDCKLFLHLGSRSTSNFVDDMILCCKFLDVKNLRERDGVPDLRRRARSRYASVALPEVRILNLWISRYVKKGGQVTK